MVGEVKEVGPEYSAAFLRSVLAAVPSFIIRTDAQFRIRYINHLQPGLQMQDVLGSDSLAFNAPECRDSVRACLERVVTTRTPARYESIGVGAHGGLAHYACHATPIVEADNSIGVCVVATDVSEHRQREARLTQSQQKLRVALESTGIGLWRWDLASDGVEWDDRMREICGRAEPLPLPQYVDVLVHPEDREAVRAAGERILETGEYVGQPHRIVRPDGEVRWIMPTGKVFTDAQGGPECVVGGLLDITPERALEDQLRTARKMETVGNLTAGVAHNFNNMLMTLLPALESLRSVVPDSNREALDDAEHAAQRGAELVRRLMHFSGRRSEEARAPHRVDELVNRAITICRRTFDRRIVLRLDVEAELPVVICSAGDVEQVLVNLLLNARDAVTGSKQATPMISVQASKQDGGSSHRGAARDTATWVRIAVQDNGVGISSADLPRVVAPFFTTKSKVGGTGLGLATSDAIAQEHGGRLDIASEVGVGTTVSLYLPGSAYERTTPDPRAPYTRGPSPRRILLVEDDDFVRRSVERVLRLHGHEVSTASSVEQAMQRLEDCADTSLVLLDRSMPDGPGDRLVPHIRAMFPDAAVFFLTGQEVDPAHAELVDGVLFKPLPIDELLETIETALSTSTRR